MKTKENGGGEREARGCEWTKAGDTQAAAAAAAAAAAVAAAAEQQAFPIVLLSFDWGYVSQEPKARQMLHTDKRTDAAHGQEEGAAAAGAGTKW